MVSDQLARSYLKKYSEKSMAVIDEYFKQKLSEASRISTVSGEMIGIAEHMVKTYWDFLGGKNIRGALIYLGYDLVHQGANKAILYASSSIQVIHSFLLMHDDIMDEDALRRGKPTVHKTYEALHRNRGFQHDPVHFGTSMAIDLGDCGAFMGMEILATANLPETLKTKAIAALGRLLLQTAFGQAMDVTYEAYKKVTEHDVMRVHTYKTAYYTVAGPLSVGAILAGAPGRTSSLLEQYGVPVGITFQLRDDELGLYSSEEELGKPIGSDVREGKNTILKLKAMELASSEDKRFLMYAYGNKNISAKDVRKVQDITAKCGALAYSQKLSRQLVEKGKRIIPKITRAKKYQDLLESFAELMITRES